MDWSNFIRHNQLQRGNLLFQELNTGSPVDWDIVQDLCCKAFQAGFKESSKRNIVLDKVDEDWIKYWKQQKNLIEF